MPRIAAVRHLPFVLAGALMGCAVGFGSGREPEVGSLRTLTGSEVRTVLAGNTLVGRDDIGPFWMHYPSHDTVWGLSSNGDVDIGRWWVSGNHYCRSWRHWLDGRKQCWLFASDGSGSLIWIEPSGRSSGESTIQAGNTIGRLTRPQQAAALIGSDAAAPVSAFPTASAAIDEEVPVDASGALLVIRNVADRGDDGPGGIDAGGRGGNVTAGRGTAPGGSPGQGSSSGDDGAGGNSGGGASSGSSGSGGSAGSADDQDDDGRGDGDDDDGGKGQGRGGHKGDDDDRDDKSDGEADGDDD
jgi:hypothetical protein